MVHDIRAEFDFILHNVDWMDNLTKSRYAMHNIVFPLLVGVFLYVMYYVWDGVILGPR